MRGHTIVDGEEQFVGGVGLDDKDPRVDAGLGIAGRRTVSEGHRDIAGSNAQRWDVGSDVVNSPLTAGGFEKWWKAL